MLQSIFSKYTRRCSIFLQNCMICSFKNRQGYTCKYKLFFKKYPSPPLSKKISIKYNKNKNKDFVMDNDAAVGELKDLQETISQE